MNYEQMYGYYRTRTFTDIFPSTDDFVNDYNECELEKTISEKSIRNLYNLLYARYGNSHIASFDENTFRYKLWSIVFMYGPTWEKRLEMQKQIRELTEEELMSKGHNINNIALNPNTGPQNDAMTPLDYISQQTFNGSKRGKLDALITQYNQLATDVTESFITEFKKLFLTVVFPEEPGWYITYQED